MAVELAGVDVALVGVVLDDVVLEVVLDEVALDVGLVAELDATVDDAEPEGLEEEPEPPVHCEMTTVSRMSAAPPIPIFLSRPDRLLSPPPVGEVPENDDPGQVLEGEPGQALGDDEADSPFDDDDADQALGPECAEL